MVMHVKTLVFVAIAAITLAGATMVSADLVFHDDFEDDTIGANPATPLVGEPWINIGTLTGHTVQANPLVNADNSSSQALLSNRMGEPAGRAFFDITADQSARLEAGELLTVRFQHYQPDPGRASIAFAIYQNDFLDFSENSIDVEFLANREVKHYKDAINNFETTGLFGTDGWDDVEIIVNFATDRWSISLNGGAPAANLPFRNDGDYATAAMLLISPSVGQMTGYTDNIRVYIGEAPGGGGDNADFDADGDVDGSDFISWQRGFGTTSGAARMQGDADGNQSVDGADLGIWAAQFGGNAPSLAAVPEPAVASMALTAIAGCGLARRRARGRNL